MNKSFCVFVFFISCSYLSADVNLYFQRALTGKVVGNPILDERRNTITVLTKDRWLVTYNMSLEKKYSYRIDRTPYPFLLKDFDNGYYIITVRDEVQKISRGRLVWKHRLGSPPVKAPSIGDGYILIPQGDSRVVALRLGDGRKVFEVNTEGKALTSAVVLENGNFYIANESYIMLSFSSLGEIIWSVPLVSCPNVFMVNTNNNIIVGYQSGDVVIYDGEIGKVLGSINLNYPINFLFEKFNGEYVAISNVGALFNLSRDLGLRFTKDLSFSIKEAVLYNNRNLFIALNPNGVLSLDEHFRPVNRYDSVKEVSGLSANFGVIATGGLNWVLTTYYYEYEDELNVKIWNHPLGNRYHQNRIDFKARSLVDDDEIYSSLDKMLDSEYSKGAYNEFINTLDSLAANRGSFPKKYLDLYRKAFSRWLFPRGGIDRITQRGGLYKYFIYVNDESSIKSLIRLAIEEKDISNITEILKNVSRFEYYHEQYDLIYNYIQYVILNYQGSLDIAYAVLLNLRRIILNSTEESLKIYKGKCLTLLKFIKRQNFSEKINKYIDEIIGIF
ncbi:PQQ-binding-like beta-propeller repeat protein [Borrelia sp. BU AG58]|uniref:outer membrane protein assembly factor BamB family protein n=1 Tax=Borrelia sp. BU AG58 TaxID=2887345 RepID=UPI001E3A5D5F|nr:PQQ-binding-like beta-propeller repeat protein [Borrelia sp. BU AG58]UER67888.1 PQQ-binding-like beta-propeller repeat protein [Borrelia sp. BU AG58]